MAVLFITQPGPPTDDQVLMAREWQHPATGTVITMLVAQSDAGHVHVRLFKNGTLLRVPPFALPVVTDWPFVERGVHRIMLDEGFRSVRPEWE